MTMYSNDEINKRLQKELINAVAKVQDSMGVRFITVDMKLDIYGSESKVKFSIVPSEVLKPVS